MTDWLGKIIDILGNTTIWCIGLAFLFYKAFGDTLGIIITNETVLSIWNIIGIVCLAGMLVKSIVSLYSFFIKKIEQKKDQVKQEQECQQAKIKQEQELHQAQMNKEAARVDLLNKRILLLNSLTPDQKVLLQDFCLKNQRTLHSYEIGGYHCLWMPDMKVLIHKGIVKAINHSTFEIVEAYYQIVQDALRQNSSSDLDE